MRTCICKNREKLLEKMFSDENDLNSLLNEDNLNKLLRSVAFSVKKTDNGESLIKNENQDQERDFRCARTKKYIANEATKLIKSFGRIQSDENMALYASKRQISRLFRVCQNEGSCLSCYSFVILHVIIQSINEREILKDTLEKMSDLIFNLANNYLLDYPDDALAQYIVDCYKVYRLEVESGLSEDFPDIHRWYVKPENAK